MKVFICGASGILGRELCKVLTQNQIPFLGSYHLNPVPNSVKADFHNLEELQSLLSKNEITICVNCIVERQVDKCEKNWELIKKTNIDIPNNLSKVCCHLQIHLIHISTDYVFDGLNPPYYPESIPNPLQNYGISKLISEFKVKNRCKKYSIIRVPVLYTDDIKELSDTAVTLIGKKIFHRFTKYQEDNYSIRRPNYIPDFCNFILDRILKCENGIFHFCNPYDKISKYTIAQTISKILNKKCNIYPIDASPKDNVERPLDTLLLDNKYKIEDYKFTPIDQGLRLCFDKFFHPSIIEFPKDIFLVMDLDGTILKTDQLHFQCYQKALKELYNYTITYNEYMNSCSTGLDDFLKSLFNIDLVKASKNKYMKEITSIDWMPGAEDLIEKIIQYDINHVIVTNTSQTNVNHFKSMNTKLGQIKNWITRENYICPKPSSECYQLALQHFRKNEKYVIGIENTMEGFRSVKGVTDCIYLIDERQQHNPDFLKLDAYLITNLRQIWEDNI